MNKGTQRHKKDLRARERKNEGSYQKEDFGKAENSKGLAMYMDRFPGAATIDLC